MNNENKIKRVLVVVDMVNGFVKEGPLHYKGITHIVPEITRLIKSDFDDIIFFRDYHKKDSIEFNYFAPHCLANSSESEIISELKPFEKKAHTYYKNSTSGVFALDYLERINELKNLEQMVITGCCTDLCIMNLAIPQKNYFNEHNKDVDVIVPIDAVSTYDIPKIHDKDEYQEMAFKLMKLNGVKVINHYGGECL